MAGKNRLGGTGARMGRAGVIIPVLMMCGLLVSACSSEGSAAPKKTSPARVTTETIRIGRFTQIFDTPLPADPAQASVVEGFHTAMILWDKSQENLMLVSPVTAYVTGSALHTGVRHIHSARSDLRGTVRRARRACLALRFGQVTRNVDQPWPCVASSGLPAQVIVTGL